MTLRMVERSKITHSHAHPNPAAHPNLDTHGFVITKLFANPIKTKGEQAPQLWKTYTVARQNEE